jgi:peptidoglycan/xylan/chitin deacetylase (PgdA/CDA1 family)
MRVDRVLSLAYAKRIPAQSKDQVAILMYHGIHNGVENKRHPYFNTVTCPARFSDQMEWLVECGAEVVDLQHWNDAKTPDDKPRVAITFDDGFGDFADHAFPVLHRLGFPVTMFLPTAFLGTSQTLLPGMPHLEWSEVRDLRRYGVHFGSHSAYHRPMQALSRQEIREELRVSAAAIENHLNEKVTRFSCPFAYPQAHPAIVSHLAEGLKDFGYTVAVTTKVGTASLRDDPLSLRRLPINSEDDKELFLAKLQGGYDWVGKVQRLARGVKRMVGV